MPRLDKPATEAGQDLESFARGLALSDEQVSTIVAHVALAEIQAVRMITVDLQRLLAELDDTPRALNQVLLDHALMKNQRENARAVHVPIRSRPQRTESGDMPDDMVEVH